MWVTEFLLLLYSNRSSFLYSLHFLLRAFRQWYVIINFYSADQCHCSCSSKTTSNGNSKNCTPSIFLDFIVAGWQLYSLLYSSMTWTKPEIFESKQQRTFCPRYGFVRSVASYHVSIGSVFDLFFFQINDIFVLFLSYRLVFGTLYPAYSSYKAIKTKNVREYVRNIYFVPCLTHIVIFYMLSSQDLCNFFSKCCKNKIMFLS